MATEYASEIHRLLKLGDHTDHSNLTLPQLNGAPHGLPVFGNFSEPGPVIFNHAGAAVLENKISAGLNVLGSKASKFRSLLIYPVIFVVAFFFFYLILNFSSVLAQIQGAFTHPQDQQILGSQLAAYQQWINGYFYAVSDPKLLDPNNDIDKDGLTNYDEFIMQTNPIVADSDGDGYPDGMEVINSYNPWGAGVMTAAQKKLASSLDLGLINNRISFNASQTQGGVVSGANTSNFDLNMPGRLSIPKLNLSVPLIWSADPSDFETDLTKGVIHYPGTAMPGEQGTVYISGHSSDYIWKHDPMESIFAKINYLKPGDDIFIDVYGPDGKVYNYRYQVTGNAVYKPDDQTQFIDNSTNKLNLSTCWPIGTATNRMVVSAVEVGL